MVNLPVEQVTPAAQHRDILCLFWQKKLKVNRYRAAADHSRTGHFARVQVVGSKLVAAAVVERAACALNAQPLHRAAANRAEHTAVFQNSHFRPRAARHGAGRGQNAAQHHALAARKCRKHLIKNHLHIVSCSFAENHAVMQRITLLLCTGL